MGNTIWFCFAVIYIYIALWYFEECDMVLWIWWYGTLKKVVCYFEEGGAVLWRGRYGLLRHILCLCFGSGIETFVKNDAFNFNESIFHQGGLYQYSLGKFTPHLMFAVDVQCWSVVIFAEKVDLWFGHVWLI